MKKKYIKGAIIVIIISLIIGGIITYRKISVYRNIDASYQESFPDFTTIKENLKGKKLVIHMKTGFSYDDAQGCVAFNMAFASLKSGIDTTVLVDASGTYIFQDKKLYGYAIPERMRKSLASQAGMDISDVPKTYGELTTYLADNGVTFIMNGTMNVVSGKRDRVYKKFDNYPFIQPVSMFESLNVIMNADRYVSY